MSSSADTIRRMWETRPPRIPSSQGGNAKIAGVCEGIGARYQIDPTVVRVGFVVAALTLGGGIPAYALAWLCMPRYGMSLSPIQAIGRPKAQLNKQEMKESSLGWILSLILVITFLGSAGNNGSMASSATGAVILLLLSWYALYRYAPLPPAGLLAQPPAQTMPQPVDFSNYEPLPGNDYPPGRTTPPAWDPLGAAPFAWDLPEPTPVAQPKRRSRIWMWILMGLGAALLVSVLLSLAVVTVFRYSDTALGEDQNYQPTSATELAESYAFDVGSATVDFRELPELKETEEIMITGGIGELEIHLPAGIPVELTCEPGLGENTCESGTYNDDAPGESLLLTVDAGIGETTVFY
ncbi:PspC domain-containing protein [Corynebacterium alimapuense]|uniref:Phage shock protein PspC N-terminal domain-containing protein n=1 Tax=Corynebacterium alimapuense TaxID=1576874 RepID=A0A3M8K6S5_9CORY|nr:PspC domain-containing protein [Corynebacterium alimapuense]RNE48830.1 hypothetical protein C5L39_05890 [Corynebacterium alimapuense]